MPNLIQKKNLVLLNKIESAYGTDASAVGSNAILCHDVDFTLLDNTSQELGDYNGRFGSQGSITTKQMASGSFGVWLAGSGDRDLAPAWGNLLQMCGFAETVDSVTTHTVTYTPVSDGLASSSLYFGLENYLQKLLGTRGKVVFNLDKGTLPDMKFNTMSLYQAPTVEASAIASVDTSAFNNPQAIKSDLVAVSLFGASVMMSKLTVDPGIVLKHLDDIDGDEIAIEDRKGTVSISFRTNEQELVDYLGRASTNAAGALNYVHGTTAGRTFTLNVPNAQVKSSKIAWDGEFAQCAVELDIVPTAANNDLTLVQS